MAKRDRRMSVASITDEDVTGAISRALQKKLQFVRNPYYALAERYGWGERKAKAIVRGEYCPSRADLLNMMANDDDVFNEVLKLTGRDGRKWDEQARAIRDILEGN